MTEYAEAIATIRIGSRLVAPPPFPKWVILVPLFGITIWWLVRKR